MAEQLLSEESNRIEHLTLIPGTGGCFEVKVDDTLVFSKLQLKRHAEDNEIVQLFRRFMSEHSP